jgi:hypothetical protein
MRSKEAEMVAAEEERVRALEVQKRELAALSAQQKDSLAQHQRMQEHNFNQLIQQRKLALEEKQLQADERQQRLAERQAAVKEQLHRRGLEKEEAARRAAEAAQDVLETKIEFALLK